MQKGNTSPIDALKVRKLLQLTLPRSYTDFLGHKILWLILTVQGLGAFALITLGVMVKKFRVARTVIRPLVYHEIARSGLQLLPMFLLLAAALGLLVIGQTVSQLSNFGAINYLGTIMATVVVRELGPLIAALMVLARIGTANVVELGTARALGEVEALEALGIDPVHYLVVPRVAGMCIGIFILTVYLILGSLFSGYLVAFVQNVPLRPGEYFSQLVAALNGRDFILVALKAFLFGFFITIVTCYHGLAQPLRLEEVSHATVRAVAQSIIACILIDALFIVVYLVV